MSCPMLTLPLISPGRVGKSGGFKGSGRRDSVACRSVATPSPSGLSRTRVSGGDGTGVGVKTMMRNNPARHLWPSILQGAYFRSARSSASINQKAHHLVHFHRMETQYWDGCVLFKVARERSARGRLLHGLTVFQLAKCTSKSKSRKFSIPGSSHFSEVACVQTVP